MRILVLSDSHGSRRKVEAAAAEQPEAEVILHLGDGVDDSEDLTYLYPKKTIVRVRGNCDRYSDLPIEATVTVNGKTILLTHGHEFRVKYTMPKQSAQILCCLGIPIDRKPGIMTDSTG